MTVELGDISLTQSDLGVIRRQADELELAAQEQIAGSGMARYGGQTTDVRMLSADESYFRVLNLTLEQGRLPTADESMTSAPVVILGQRIKETLFGSRPFMNEHISIMMGDSSLVLRVIGVFREKGGAAGTELDGSVYISPSLGAKIASAKGGKLILLLKDDNRSTIAKYQVKALLAPKFGDKVQISDAREAIEKTKAIWGKQNLVGIITDCP